MKNYSDEIALVKNKRGVYDLDTSKGCSLGTMRNKNGCYGACYAAESAKRYGYDFTTTILRGFLNRNHIGKIINEINRINMPFIRIGVTGDPSENWEHTLSVIDKVRYSNKAIVVITKHWSNLSTRQAVKLSKANVCVNTSTSALDDERLRRNRLIQYKRLKDYCMSVLRIVSCDFNTENKNGSELNDIQCTLFENDNTLDTVLRVSKTNSYLTNGIINVSNMNFLKKTSLLSMKNNGAFIGHCSGCPDMCGVNLFEKKQNQLQLF